MTQQLNIGILGAGRVGTAVGRQAVRAGHTVRIATGKPAEDIKLLTEVIVPGAQAVNKEDLRGSDIIVLAVPLHKYRSIDTSVLQGHPVIDTMNYWAPVDGVMEEFETGSSTSEVINEFLGDVELVKTLNHIGYGDLEVDSHPAGDPQRRALAVASDHEDAKQLVAAFVDTLGYDAVDAGPLAAGKTFENGTEIFNGRHSAEQMRALLDQCQNVLAEV
ncbi:NAD(P)-binding domain-containing protein [Nesterenkonia sp. MY13]|uniref:NAD(P)-binding domain-containing protein n=1 Tax=Nesterenkonia sedimenti TaxID=1463632 RepID=A0A7X8YD39_9MICC|nr:NAD(P)-binding domain-containing protein [Nesterenkonia sedimenti]NLS09219.1 NAD(P)-binding domain-containing protein [Nesterenkonia sedimenti]